MSQGNGHTTLSLMERLQAGMVSAKIPSSVPNARKRSPDDTVVAECDEFLKRLRAYHMQLINDMMPLREEAQSLERSLIDAIGGLKQKTDAAALFLQLAGLSTPELQKKAARLQELAKQIRPQAAYANWVGDYFWAEAKSRFPAIAESDSVALRSDWSLVVDTDDDHDHEPGGFGELIASLMGRSGRGPSIFRVDRG